MENPEAAAPLPRGLRGTRPSGGLNVDAEGHFVPDRDALLFFEYFGSASNEEGPAALLARIRGAIDVELAPPAREEAHAFLARWVAYLEAGEEEFAAPGLAESADLERRLQWVRELRREHFGAALAERLFGEEEAAQRVELARRRVLADEALGAEERRAALVALEAEYPEAVREARARASLPLRHANEERALREAGAGDAEIRALREARFGADAADRMAALDAERAAFAARLDRYREERDARLAGVEDPARRSAIHDEVLADHFEEPDWARVRVLEATR